ncbi:MAG: hypothetical protein IKU27_03250 [Clostridia bacterium]|nr:hypothetical protein [Clostridia bacterium]
MSGGTVYRCTLEEYKRLKRELNELESLCDLLSKAKSEYRVGAVTAAYHEARTTVWNERQYVNVTDWRGADAASYKSTIDEIHAALAKADSDFYAGVANALDQALKRRRNLKEFIRLCEEEGQMTLGGLIVVETAQLLGIEVED